MRSAYVGLHPLSKSPMTPPRPGLHLPLPREGRNTAHLPFTNRVDRRLHPQSAAALPTISGLPAGTLLLAASTNAAMHFTRARMTAAWLSPSARLCAANPVEKVL